MLPSPPGLRAVDPVDQGEPARSGAQSGWSAVLELPPARPPARAGRFVRAYWTTFMVIASYMWLRFTNRFRGAEGAAQAALRVHRRNARRVERTISRLQGLFIKVGQLISIMTNFLPEAFRAGLEGLQDQVPPRPFADIEARLREEFGGQSVDALFAEFNRRPVAAASIGQVHAARLKSGERVAVKVQYPNIDEVVRIDLRLLRRIFRITAFFVPYRGLDEAYKEICEVVTAELDFRREAENGRRIAKNFATRTDVAFPQVIDELTTSRVLTTRWEDAIKIGDRERLTAAGFDKRALARQVVEAYCQQIFVDGVYHADPHPGNVLVRERGAPTAPPAGGEGRRPEPVKGGGATLVFLDFGAVCEVSPKMRNGIVDFLQGALHRDTQRIVRAMRDMGFVARDADERTFERVIEYFHERFQEEIQLDSFNLKDIKLDAKKSLEGLADLRRMDISLRELSASFHVPKEWILLERTILLLMGLCTQLDPDMNPMQTIRPYLERFVLGPNEDWSGFVVDATKELATAALSLPGEIRRFMARAQRGELEIQFAGIDRTADRLVAVGRQVIYTMVGVTAAALAVVFEGRGQAGAAVTAWRVCAGAAVVLGLSLWTSRSRRRRRR